MPEKKNTTSKANQQSISAVKIIHLQLTFYFQAHKTQIKYTWAIIIIILTSVRDGCVHCTLYIYSMCALIENVEWIVIFCCCCCSEIINCIGCSGLLPTLFTNHFKFCDILWCCECIRKLKFINGQYLKMHCGMLCHTHCRAQYNTAQHNTQKPIIWMVYIIFCGNSVWLWTFSYFYMLNIVKWHKDISE